jgi:hypothetical protein
VVAKNAVVVATAVDLVVVAVQRHAAIVVDLVTHVILVLAALVNLLVLECLVVMIVTAATIVLHVVQAHHLVLALVPQAVQCALLVLVLHMLVLMIPAQLVLPAMVVQDQLVVLLHLAPMVAHQPVAQADPADALAMAVVANLSLIMNVVANLLHNHFEKFRQAQLDSSLARNQFLTTSKSIHNTNYKTAHKRAVLFSGLGGLLERIGMHIIPCI